MAEHPKRKQLLVVAAHPDDEVLGCGATVRRLVDQGWAATLLVMTGGVSGRCSGDDITSDATRAAQDQLSKETAQAAAILGFQHVSTLSFPDNRLDTVGRMDLAHAITTVIKEFRPTLLLTHHAGDYNWDHGRVHDAVMMAGRANPPDDHPDEIWAFETNSSTERAWQRAETAFLPTIYMEVSETIDAKIQAMRCYTSEIRPSPHPRSVEGIEILARRRGSEVGRPYAEAFSLVRKIYD
ncbi:PIG-L deacetylase family protein [Thalassospiraceae bacterium LMO-JJ14]|nr:PIG-L deacetylase family protein [Thalassospiraceae bacterium LMO-JJ14]